MTFPFEWIYGTEKKDTTLSNDHQICSALKWRIKSRIDISLYCRDGATAIHAYYM